MKVMADEWQAMRFSTRSEAAAQETDVELDSEIRMCA